MSSYNRRLQVSGEKRSTVYVTYEVHSFNLLNYALSHSTVCFRRAKPTEPTTHFCSTMTVWVNKIILCIEVKYCTPCCVQVPRGRGLSKPHERTISCGEERGRWFLGKGVPGWSVQAWDDIAERTQVRVVSTHASWWCNNWILNLLRLHNVRVPLAGCRVKLISFNLSATYSSCFCKECKCDSFTPPAGQLEEFVHLFTTL